MLDIDPTAFNAEPARVPVDKIPDLVRTLRAAMLVAQVNGFICYNGIVPARIAILRGLYAKRYGKILASTL